VSLLHLLLITHYLFLSTTFYVQISIVSNFVFCIFPLWTIDRGLWTISILHPASCILHRASFILLYLLPWTIDRGLFYKSIFQVRPLGFPYFLSCSQNLRISLLFYAVYIHLTDSIYFLPFSVSRYFCNRLFGFSGMVYSMKFAASNSFTALFKEPVLLFNFNL